MMNYSYLALGDSYTIGEQVLLAESFPYQTVQLLRQKNIPLCAPEIIAKTGWTTDELESGIEDKLLLKKYDFVSLLIGVNNQYRNRGIEEYAIQFKHLLQKAIQLSGNNVKSVFVLSIPDWSITAFAKDRDTAKIAVDIDAFNETNKIITENFCCSYIDITTSQRKDGNNAKMVAADGLHPSGLEYKKWANKLATAILQVHST